MESFYFLLLGTVLLFLHPSVYAIAVREMVIEASPADVDSEEIASALALIEAPPADDNTEEIENALALPSAEENEFDPDTQGQVQPFHGAVDDFFIEEDAQTEEADSNAGDIGHWWGNKMIAFSTYLSAARYVGARQHIKFDRVLLNDGNAYEPYTGIFRAPVSGVYSFTFVIGQSGRNEIRTNLVVDGRVVIGAISEGSRYLHDVQGTNTVNVHVRKGKLVWVEAYSSGRLEGHSSNFRYTSFSGHLLYKRW